MSDSGNYFSDGTNRWKAETLWQAAKDLPVEEVPIETLLSTTEVRRILRAGLEHPVILGPQGGVLDGFHRIAKAWLTGQQSLLVQRLPVMPVPDDDINYNRSALLDLLEYCLNYLTPTTSTHEEIVGLLHKERGYVCMCGYCPPTARSRNNGPCPKCGAIESHNCPGEKS